ncbi:MAG: hypothetical protein QW379_08975 [Thermoplasmata archaeon]
MPAKSKGTLQSIARWRHYIAATRSNIADFPELRTVLNEFERDVAAFEELNRKQESLKAELKATTSAVRRGLRELEKRATAIKRRWEAKYGRGSKKLRELSPTPEARGRSAGPG